MKNALEKEEALDELGQSFQNYLSILHSDESVADSVNNITAQGSDSSKMVTLDPYTVNQRIRRASILHVKRLSHAVDEEEKKSKSNVLFWLFLSVTAAVVGCSLGLAIYKTAGSPDASTSGILTSSLVLPSVMGESEKDAEDIFGDDIKLPAFIDIFASNDISSKGLLSNALSSNTKETEIPLLLDIPGTGSEYLPSVFTKCLGLKKASSLNQNEEIIDFASTETLCGISKKFLLSGKAKLMIFMRNPIVRVVQEYLNKHQHKQTSLESLRDYLNDSSFTDNLQTRKLVCKPKGKIGEADLAAAKYILKKLSVLGMYQDASDAFKSYRTAFSWGSSPSPNIDECIEKEFEKSSSNAADLEKRLNENDVVKAIREKNEIDMKLYLYALSLN